MCFKNVIVLLTLLTITFGAKLPSYMKKCKYSDPKLNECIKQHANAAVPYVIKGDRTLRFPPLAPLKITEVVTEPGPNLKVIMRNVSVYGLENIKIEKIGMDFEALTLHMETSNRRIELQGEYDMNGKILILPIQGKGPANITIMDGYYIYDLKFKYATKKEKKYYSIIDYKMKYDTSRVYYKFANLFNGNKRLGDQMNLFMNENWKDLHKDLGSGVGDTMAEVITTIFTAVFTSVPYEDLWDFS